MQSIAGNNAYGRTAIRALPMPPTSVSLPLFLKCAGVATLSGVVVWIEPAPCDVAIVLLLIVGLLLGCLSFRPLHALPALLLGGFAIANLLSMVNAVDLQLGWRRAGISLYLVASWFFFTGVVTRYGEPAARLLIQCYNMLSQTDNKTVSQLPF